MTIKLRHPQDVLLGAHLRKVRESKNLTLRDFALECGISWQQMQKHENGETRIGYSRLTEIAKALDEDVIALLAPLSGMAAVGFMSTDGEQVALSSYVTLLKEPLALELLEAFAKIGNVDTRKALLNVAREMESPTPDPKAR
jgi:transcriptional regulator with XRE-family HTH domain